MTRDELAAHARRLNLTPESLAVYLDAGRGVLAPGARRRMNVMAKPAGSACNLACTYCYYAGKKELLGHGRLRMSEATLERFVSSYIRGQDAEEIAFVWQGGEPTLLGLDFFRRVVALQAKHVPRGRRVTNDLQTNGTLLDDAWCAFLAANRFVVGLSVDGPRELHEAHRPTRRGTSSFDRVLDAAARLHRHRVPFATLTVVSRRTAARPLEVYRFLRDEVGSTCMQLLPCVQPRGFETTAPGGRDPWTLPDADAPEARPDHASSVVTEWSVDPDEWGTFLCSVFDEWAANDRGVVKVDHFESARAQLAGGAPLQCSKSPHCGKNVAVEHDGRVYACDHYVYPEWELGSVHERPLAELVFSLRQLELGLAKRSTLPRECRRCPHLRLCWGDCPRTRLLRTRPGEGPLSYLCRGWRRFFDHAVPVLAAERAPPMRRGEEASRTTTR